MKYRSSYIAVTLAVLFIALPLRTIPQVPSQAFEGRCPAALRAFN